MLLIIFTLLSLIKLEQLNTKLISFLVKDFNDDSIQFVSITNNLDNLINSYSFKKIDKVFNDNKYKIYLYNTHNLEEYSDNKTVLDAAELLKNSLNKLGVNVIKEKKKTSELLYTGLKYYDISRIYLKNIMDKETNIKYFVDIHRDSVSDTSVTINKKKYAKIMFVLGLNNEKYMENKEVINKMNNYLNENYPGLSRGIYEKRGDDVDGVYNQDLNRNVILIEIGGVKNNMEEVKNSTEILALMFYHILGD